MEKISLYPADIYQVVDRSLISEIDKLVLNIGFSHPVEVVEENGVKLNVVSATEVAVEGISKEAVGAMAAKIRAIRPVEPYHGYGIRYTDEKVSLKEGKSSGKGGKK